MASCIQRNYMSRKMASYIQCNYISVKWQAAFSVITCPEKWHAASSVITYPKKKASCIQCNYISGSKNYVPRARMGFHNKYPRNDNECWQDCKQNNINSNIYVNEDNGHET